MAESAGLGGFSRGLTSGIAAVNDIRQLRQQKEAQQQEAELRRQTIEITRQQMGQQRLEAESRKYESGLKTLVDAVNGTQSSDQAAKLVQSLANNGVLKGLNDQAEVVGASANAEQLLMSLINTKRSEEAQLAFEGQKAGVVANAQAEAQSRFTTPSFQPVYSDQGVLSFNNRSGGAAPLQSPTGNPVMPINANPALAAEMAAGRAGGLVTGAREAGASPGQKAIDTAFGAEYAAFNAGGGFADVQKSLSQLSAAADKISKSDNLTGPVVGNVPDFIGGFINPDAINTREQVQEVAQRNLRLVLGAQFTEKEGDRLIARVFNPKLDESTNKARIELLAEQIATAAAAKQAAGQYFDQHGTLQGYQGKLYTITDFTDSMNHFDKKTKDAEKAAEPDADGWRTLPNGVKVRVKTK